MPWKELKSKSNGQWHFPRLLFQTPMICSLVIFWDRPVAPNPILFYKFTELLSRPTWSFSIHNILQEGALQLNYIIPTCSVKHHLPSLALNVSLRWLNFYIRWDNELMVFSSASCDFYTPCSLEIPSVHGHPWCECCPKVPAFPSSPSQDLLQAGDGE